MAVVSCELKKVEGGRKWCVCLQECVCEREGRRRRGAEEGGLSDALELPFFFPDKDSICHRAICCLPSRRSIRHAAFTLMSPLHSSRLAADAVHTKGRTHNPRPGKRQWHVFPDIPARARPVSLTDTLFGVGTFLTLTDKVEYPVKTVKILDQKWLMGKLKWE